MTTKFVSVKKVLFDNVTALKVHLLLVVRVTRVPECFVMRDKFELRVDQSANLQLLLEKLTSEVASILIQTKGGFRLMPSTVHEVLCSIACKGLEFLPDHLSSLKPLQKSSFSKVQLNLDKSSIVFNAGISSEN